MSWDDVLLPVQPDDLVTPEVGSWAEQKHRLLLHYATLFLTSLRGKWDFLVYLDLYAGSGMYRLKDSNRYYLASSMAILSMPEAFDAYIFCDASDENTSALKTRIDRIAPNRSTVVLTGDSNQLVDQALEHIPRGSKSRRVLSLCFLDPFRLRNLRFEMVRKLANRYMDFLVLIPSAMDANRNETHYVQEDSDVLDSFLGNRDWRERWPDEKARKVSFEQFIVTEFGRSMAGLGYIDPGMENAEAVSLPIKNVRLYRLVLYSKKPLGKKFWEESRKYTNPQTSFGF